MTITKEDSVKSATADATTLQYHMVTARRNHYDTVLWQTPILSMTAQAFLFSVALGASGGFERQLASILAFVVALASAQLMLKHRAGEYHYAVLAQKIEKDSKWPVLSDQSGVGKGIAAWSSFKLWMWVYLVFAVAAILAFLRATGLF